MPQDPNLYGQRPAKKQKKEIAVSSSLSFASQLTSLMASSSASASASSAASTTTAARPRPSKTKPDIFSGVRAKRKEGGKSRADDADDDGKLVLKSPVGTEDDKAERARTRRKMEEKARLYAAMKRGDYIPREGEAAPLVDFDRKWAEAGGAAGGGGGSDTSSDDSEDDYEGNNAKDEELVEYEDEFGRARLVTRAEKARQERRLARGLASEAELERMSARPRAPDNVIYGDTVQARAFAVGDEVAEADMAALAAKRDRSATPPPAAHYDAAAEVRNRGTGFYAFSKDEDMRVEEMRGLAAERMNTEQVRQEREEKKEARRREIEERRKQIGERRAKRMADTFLEDLGKDIMSSGGGDEGAKEVAGSHSGDIQAEAGK